MQWRYGYVADACRRLSRSSVNRFAWIIKGVQLLIGCWELFLISTQPELIRNWRSQGERLRRPVCNTTAPYTLGFVLKKILSSVYLN